MNFKNGLKFDSQNLGRKRRVLWVVSLLFVVSLVFSSFVSVLSDVVPFVSGAADILVSNETELRNAVKNVVGPTVVTLISDINLTGVSPLVISAGKDITLTSSDDAKFFKLIGPNGVNTVTVEKGGILRLDGVIITHMADADGRGVIVNVGGTFYLYGGEIFGNTGSGVVTSGTFEMYGGVIANNTSHGVSIVKNDVTIVGNFTMFGGVIANNTAFKTVFTPINPETVAGGGVYIAT